MGLNTKPIARIHTPDATLNRIQDGIIAAFNPLVLTPFTWITVGQAGGPAFSNGWTIFDTRTPQFTIDLLGFVLIRGVLASGTIGQPAFILPVGYRPSRNLRFAVDANSAYGMCLIKTDGSVIPSVGSNVFFFLDGIRFVQEA